MSPASAATVAIVVTFKPERERLDENLQALLPQVGEVLVVDNSPDEAAALAPWSAEDRVTVLRMGANLGIAHAQNRGIAWARERQARHVLLMDQDSVADPGMLEALHHALDALQRSGVKVGAVGPVQCDPGGDTAPRFTRFKGGRVQRIEVPAGALSMRCDALIASGTLIPMAVLEEVGGMAGDFFIDKVDIEWCLRAQRRGWEIHGVPGAHLHHRLGETTVSLTWWPGKRLPLHQPFRYYFMVRNSLLMHRMPGMGLRWHVADVVQLLQIIVFHAFLAPSASQNRPMIKAGLADGIRGVVGPLPTHLIGAGTKATAS